MNRHAFRSVLALLTVSLAAACGPTTTGPSSSSACTGYEGLSFRSVTQHEVGLGPSGPAYGYWYVHFDNGSFTYDHSDVSESGTYTCTDGTITGMRSSATPLTGQYDADAHTLVWDGNDYAPATR